MEHKNKPTKLFLEAYIYSNWFQNDELTDKEESADLTNMPPLKDDEEVKEVKGLKFLTPNKLLTRLSILLAQTKAGDNLYKLKNEIRQTQTNTIFSIRIIKSPKKFTTI